MDGAGSARGLRLAVHEVRRLTDQGHHLVPNLGGHPQCGVGREGRRPRRFELVATDQFRGDSGDVLLALLARGSRPGPAARIPRVPVPLGNAAADLLFAGLYDQTRRSEQAEVVGGVGVGDAQLAGYLGGAELGARLAAMTAAVRAEIRDLAAWLDLEVTSA